MNDKKKDPIDENDLDLFRQSVADARPLKPQNSVQHSAARAEPALKRKQSQQDEGLSAANTLSDEYPVEEVGTADELLFSRPGLQHRVVKNLRRGQFNCSAVLDLHGMVVNEARQALVEFIRESRAHNARYVRIVHGKGHGSSSRLPMLKNRVNNWLRQIDGVLAFCSAQPRDGGTGAIYLLLKRDSRD
ncbi:MAG: Smr/MutS family protein [Thiotrichaceae bacterium]|nr:Smr/MutS family protein [Thiotrichaceae bacterium]PCI14109.1 MAG: DNA mismatch repair protein MutS [Thiotrichales bacterium]